MNKHTPGPWTAMLNGLNPHGDIVSEQFTIARIDCRYGAIGEPEANARLIAAAPEMYAECEKIVANCEFCDDGFIEYQPSGLDGYLPTGDANFVTEPCPNCSNARAIIAKIKGES